MKVFVYNKKDSKRINVIKDVLMVSESYDQIRIHTLGNVIFYCTKTVKTRIYQN